MLSDLEPSDGTVSQGRDDKPTPRSLLARSIAYRPSCSLNSVLLPVLTMFALFERLIVGHLNVPP